MKHALLIAFSLVTPTQALAAVYGTKPGTVFSTAPHGEVVEVGPHLIQTPALEFRDEWCLFKLVDGRGIPINPPAAWTKCSNLHRLIGN